MKNLLFTLMLGGALLNGTYVKAQEMIGATENQVRRAFPDYFINELPLVNGTRSIGITCILGPFMYHFGKDQLVDICILQAYSEGLRDIIEYNNRNYTKISDTKWKKYRLGKVIVIELVYDRDNDSYTFTFRESKDK